MPRLDHCKQVLRSLSIVDQMWGAMRRWQLHREYRRRRERYAQQTAGWKYAEHQVTADLRQQLKHRGYSPALRSDGQVHTFAFIPNLGWHAALVGDLQELGTLSWFDYAARGYTCAEFHRRSSATIERRREMLNLFWHDLLMANHRQPVDWIYIYAGGVEITPDILRRIKDELGIPVVGMCLDDKQSWTGPRVEGYRGPRAGQIDIASAADLWWTSARVACEWYHAEGGRAIYLPEGFDQRSFRPLPLARDLPITFIGGAYGFRRALVRHLRKCQVPVHVFGPGWNTRSVWGEEQVQILNRSVINLGCGGIGYSESLTNVKTRDFEVPGTGGGMYLTTFNPDLAQHFHIGQEIVCYRNRDELVELSRYYLRHPEEAAHIAQRARERCLREHRWLHRYQHICRVLGILTEQSTSGECSEVRSAA